MALPALYFLERPDVIVISRVTIITFRSTIHGSEEEWKWRKRVAPQDKAPHPPVKWRTYSRGGLLAFLAVHSSGDTRILFPPSIPYPLLNSLQEMVTHLHHTRHKRETATQTPPKLPPYRRFSHALFCGAGVTSSSFQDQASGRDVFIPGTDFPRETLD